MSTEVISGAIGELRSASVAGGTALTTTRSFTQLPLKSYHLFVTPRNFGGASVARIFVNPWLFVLKTLDLLSTPPIDYSDAAQDSDATTDIVLSSLGTLANGDYLLIGSHIPFGGVNVDIDAANSIASVLLVEYWNGQSWVTISATDGTASAGATFAIDGNVTWTVPTTWAASSLTEIADIGLQITNETFPGRQERLFWTRWTVSVALDSSTTVNSMVSINRSTAYFELLSGQMIEQRINHGPMGIGCVEAVTDAGTANLLVEVACLRDGEFRS